jgi:hypothetical protein
MDESWRTIDNCSIAASAMASIRHLVDDVGAPIAFCATPGDRNRSGRPVTLFHASKR